MMVTTNWYNILDSFKFAFVCLSSLVAIHDGDGHDEETDVGLEGREEGR